jgi:hypothetical protein
MRKYIVAVGNARPLNYECYCIEAKNKDEAIFQAALKCNRPDWKLLSIEYRRNLSYFENKGFKSEKRNHA